MRYFCLGSDKLTQDLTTGLTCDGCFISTVRISPGAQEEAMRRLIDSANALEEFRDSLSPAEIVMLFKRSERRIDGGMRADNAKNLPAAGEM